MRRFLPLGLVLLLVTGCADKAVRWSHPTHTQTDFARDDYECTREVKVMVKDDWVVGPLWWVITERSRGDSRAKQYHAQCMKARGYTAADELVAAGPTPTPQQPAQAGEAPQSRTFGWQERERRGGAQVGERAATATQPGLNGTYTGEIAGQARGQAFTMRVTFTLVQSGEQLVGVWNTTGGTSGTVQGVVGGSQVSDFRAKQVNPCEGAFTGAAVVEAGRLRGSYTGVDCNGPVTASFVVTRQ